MANEFEIKDLGPLKYFIRYGGSKDKKGISVLQRRYTFNLLKEIGMLGCKPDETSVVPNDKIESNEE